MNNSKGFWMMVVYPSLAWMNVYFYFYFLFGVEHISCFMNKFYLHRPYYFYSFKCGPSTYDDILFRLDNMNEFLSTLSMLNNFFMLNTFTILYISQV